jgi:hypothetical protein
VRVYCGQSRSARKALTRPLLGCRNLPLKLLRTMQWTADHHPHLHTLVKVDDDCFFNVRMQPRAAAVLLHST